ncbi:hypothetical protein FACS1894182_06220 [Bacteroidia bacterium]|nr:hypothetical protein FACS1894182_06220 [Bacteroidia bacterium]
MKIKSFDKTLCKPFILCVLIAYTVLLFYWMIFGFGRTTLPEYSCNLVPFRTIRWYWSGMPVPLWERIVNLAGNIMVFIPFGILLPPLFRGNFKKSFLVFFGFLFLFETIQLITKRGSFDTDDFILNTLGFGLGFATKWITLPKDKKKIMNKGITIGLPLLAFFISFSCGRTRAIPAETRIQAIDSIPDFYTERMQLLQLKADSAFIFCKKNGMNTDFCMLVDMRIPSGKFRFFLWDFKNDSILKQSLCAHGYGQSSTQKTPVFSNVPGSYCTSLGKYKTGIKSPSQWGIGIHYKLHGLEPANSNAYKRIVVLHSYLYIPEIEIDPEHIPLGYSQGCPVISNETMTLVHQLLQEQKKSTLLWIYY